MCVCVWYSPYIREIYQDNDLSLPQLNEQLLYYTCCTHGLLYTVGCWPWLYALLDLGEKKRKITGSFVHVWPVYVYSKMDYYYYKYLLLTANEREGPCQGLPAGPAQFLFSLERETQLTHRLTASRRRRPLIQRVGVCQHTSRHHQHPLPSHRIRTGSASEP